MDEIENLDVRSSIDTSGTEWTFVGQSHAPAWKNTTSEHHLIVDQPDDEETYRVKLNHPTQRQTWWTIHTVDFAPEILPLVEWILSAPTTDLFHRESVVRSIEPFWEVENQQIRSEIDS